MRDALGRPTGILTDDAMDLIDAVVPPPRASAVDASFQEVLEACAAAGLTGVHDLAALPGDIDYYGARADQLTLRLNVYRDAASHEHIPPVAVRRVATRARARFFCDNGSVCERAFAYGLRVLTQAMGSWTAAMLQPYSDRPSTGTMIYNTSDLLAGVKRWKARVTRSRPTPSATPRTARSSTSTSRRAHRPRPLPRRARPDPIRTGPAAFRQAGCDPKSMQTTHCASDLGYADARLGARANLSYAWRALLDSGVDVLPLGQRLSDSRNYSPLARPARRYYQGAARRDTERRLASGGTSDAHRGAARLHARRGVCGDSARTSWAPSSPGTKQTLLYSLPIR